MTRRAGVRATDRADRGSVGSMFPRPAAVGRPPGPGFETRAEARKPQVVEAADNGPDRTAQLDHREAIERSIRLASGELERRWSLRELAAEAYLSPTQFHRVFRRTTGLTPGRFFERLRMEVAQRFLVGSDRTVTDVGLEVGYQSLGSFSTRFRRTLGASPVKVRARMREAPRVDLQVPPIEGSMISGWIEGEAGFAGRAVLGLFAGETPYGRPLSCTEARVPGPFRISTAGVGRATCFLLAAADESDPEGGFPLGPLLDPSRVGRASVDLTTPPAAPPINLRLHRRSPADPPILVSVLLDP